MNYPRPGALRTMAFLLLIPGAAWPQSYQGGVRGVIQDPGGAVIAGAKVALQNQASNVARTVLSNAQGEYVFSALEPANYDLQVEAAGFKRFERLESWIAGRPMKLWPPDVPSPSARLSFRTRSLRTKCG